jgi:hypothetical protein
MLTPHRDTFLPRRLHPHVPQPRHRPRGSALPAPQWQSLPGSLRPRGGDGDQLSNEVIAPLCPCASRVGRPEGTPKHIMKTTHTPGPWHLGKPFNGFIWGPDPTRGDQSGANWPLAEILPYRNGQRCTEEDEANARLIASAPELLEALRGMVREINLGARMHTAPVEAARAAIAKATQSQP